MSSFPRAGKPVEQQDIYNIPKLMCNYYKLEPEKTNFAHLVSFGTSGHRGSADKKTFNQNHIWAITQAIVDIRCENKVFGPLFVGKDTHALSEAALISVIEVLAANKIEVFLEKDSGYTPTPSISHAIISYNKANTIKADGIIITPSHNPPQDGGIKYNSIHGGPAEDKLTQKIQDRANNYIKNDLVGIKRVSQNQAYESGLICEIDLIQPYVDDLVNIINLDAIKKAGLKIGVDPLGGSGIEYWKRIEETYNLNIELTNNIVDPSFRFMCLDSDETIRMDCSSPDAMAGLLAYREKYDLGLANDPDYDRHGIVTQYGLMNPNKYLAVCIDYLLNNRPLWPASLAIGKTIVSSSMIDNVVASSNRNLCEVPVGFKWFVDGLAKNSLAFCGEESAGASFLKFDGQTWTTDKDGIILCLLAAEITAVTGLNPHEYYTKLSDKFGKFYYKRLQAPANFQQKQILKNLRAEQIKAQQLAGSPIIECLTHASGNNIAIGGLKVVTKNGWFAARPSGTEDIYKIYCESFVSAEHLSKIENEAQQIVNQTFIK